jgi:hypothetical protein
MVNIQGHDFRLGRCNIATRGGVDLALENIAARQNLLAAVIEAQRALNHDIANGEPRVTHVRIAIAVPATPFLLPSRQKPRAKDLHPMLLEDKPQGISLGLPASLPLGHGIGVILPEQLEDDPPLLLRHDRHLLFELIFGGHVCIGKPHLGLRQNDRSEGREFAFDENPPLRWLGHHVVLISLGR